MMGLMHDMSFIRTTKCLPAKKDIPGIMNSFKKLNEDFLPSNLEIRAGRQESQYYELLLEQTILVPIHILRSRWMLSFL